ncbi:MAG: cadmium-translocating P-type ATPase [Desulfotomaculum sp.]|nr:cadmium-translocating P-type ATPase [Desulfotomaculum sp.]
MAQEIINQVEPGVELVPANTKMKKYKVKSLHCSGCAEKIQQAMSKTEGLENAELNFAAGTLAINPRYLHKAQEIIDSIEPGVTLEELNDAVNKNKEKIDIKKRLTVVGISSALFLAGLIFKDSLSSTPYALAEYIIFLTAYLLVGWHVLAGAFRNVFKGNVFDENFLMTIATIGAAAVQQLPEAVGVMLFYYVGEFFQDLAVNRSRSSIKSLINIRPEYANLKVNNKLEKVSPEAVDVGDIIVVKPGEKVPLDGVVIKGASFLDTSALTGEPVPRKAEEGEEVLAGMINTSGLLEVRVTKTFENSSAARILDLVENAANRKASTEKFITKFSRYYTPAVVFGAAALAVIPPVVLPGAVFSEWLYRALILLVISCPCALVVSIPLSYFGGIGGASRKGILIKGANFLEALKDLDTVVFDKTGTLTKGVFRVTNIENKNGFTKEDVLKFASMAEVNSNHPIAKSILKEYTGSLAAEKVESYEEIPGCGVKARYEGKVILAGNEHLLNKESIDYEKYNSGGTVVYVAVDGLFAGCIIISDEIKEDSKKAITKLKGLGINKIVMLTGDDSPAAEKAAQELGIDEVYSNLLPQDKVTKVEELIKQSTGRGKLAFVGDGINDAPVLARADVGIAMGGLGSDAAVEAADVVIMDDMPSKVSTAADIARHTRKIIIQNIIMALSIKGLFIVLGSLGIAGLWEAVFADVGVALLAVANSARVLKYNEKS